MIHCTCGQFVVFVCECTVCSVILLHLYYYTIDVHSGVMQVSFVPSLLCQRPRVETFDTVQFAGWTQSRSYKLTHHGRDSERKRLMNPERLHTLFKRLNVFFFDTITFSFNFNFLNWKYTSDRNYHTWVIHRYFVLGSQTVWFEITISTHAHWKNSPGAQIISHGLWSSHKKP